MTKNVTSPEKPLDFFWFIPTHGDGTYLGSEQQQRPPEFGYLQGDRPGGRPARLSRRAVADRPELRGFLDHRDRPGGRIPSG